jgi:hypothetical protein
VEIMTEQVKVCSICKAEYTGFGNNADPYPGRCCDLCNSISVIPARITALYSRRSAAAKKDAK